MPDRLLALLVFAGGAAFGLLVGVDWLHPPPFRPYEVSGTAWQCQADIDDAPQP